MEDIMADTTKKKATAKETVETKVESTQDIMADTTGGNADNATKNKRVTVQLPKLPGQNAIQEEFFSVNGRNYLIKRGTRVEVPEEVAEVIRNSEKAEEYAMNYVESLDQAKEDKEKELGLK